jgi:integrase
VDGLVFGDLYKEAPARLLRRLAPGPAVHGMRSTFSTWHAERTGYPEAVKEAALAHISADKVKAAYFTGTVFGL